jgi:hypothetical protein
VCQVKRRGRRKKDNPDEECDEVAPAAIVAELPKSSSIAENAQSKIVAIASPTPSHADVNLALGLIHSLQMFFHSLSLYGYCSIYCEETHS